jgi:hypothetical protein
LARRIACPPSAISSYRGSVHVELRSRQDIPFCFMQNSLRFLGAHARLLPNTPTFRGDHEHTTINAVTTLVLEMIVFLASREQPIAGRRIPAWYPASPIFSSCTINMLHCHRSNRDNRVGDDKVSGVAKPFFACPRSRQYHPTSRISGGLYTH